MTAHVHTDVVAAFWMTLTVVVMVKGGQVIAEYLGKKQGAIGSFGRAMGGALNLGVH